MLVEMIVPILLTIIVAVAGLAWWLNRKLEQLKLSRQAEDRLTALDSSVSNLHQLLHQINTNTNQTLQQALSQTDKNINDALRQSTRSMNDRLDNAAQYISQVRKEIGQMSELGQSIRSLQQFLQSPKLRGNIGEEVLKDLIGQMFPKSSFFLQYSFNSGQKVDACLKTEAGLLPIDSKFPKENFERLVDGKTKKIRDQAKKAFVNDVRKHIRDISSKYILPDEGTMDFCLMYVPSEAVYYEVVNTPKLIEYARARRVYPVSPTTLYAHLQTILLSFEGKKIEQKSREVFKLLRSIQQQYQQTEKSLSTLSTHINRAHSKISEVAQSYSLLGNKIASTRQLQPTSPDQD